MNNFFQRDLNGRVVALVLLATFSLVLGLVWLESQDILPQLNFSFSEFRSKLPRISLPKIPFLPATSAARDVKKFVSEADFKDYLAKGREITNYPGGFGGEADFALREEVFSPQAKAGGGPERVSETTVQVAGIDEPDIVKTDGREIYFSKEGYGWWGGEQKMIAPEYQNRTNLIRAFPPADLTKDSQIDKAGNLLLVKNRLIIFSGQEILGYDVSDSKKPEKKWSLELENNVWLVAARLKGDKIYLVTQTAINDANPCPIEILKGGDSPLSIRCTDIYHPVSPLPVDTTSTAMILDPASGRVEKNISFVSSSGNSVVYMSNQAVYLAYSYYEDTTQFFLNFVKENSRDLFPSWVMDKMEKLAGYDLSQQAKMMELQLILQKYQSSLSDDESLKLGNELNNRMTDYLKAHLRDLQKTGIVKIGLDSFTVLASGSVPGQPLNQFSLDEYQDNLRLATTVGQGWWGWGFGGSQPESANDVYVLDKNLKTVGQVLNLGLTERIYSARFVGERGYLVTFRQTDPFYVLDLSDPRNPQMKGELKIPGYSSYLEPIDKDLVLGIGQEGGQVKISLFDVSSAQNPRELDKYILNEGWSEVLSTHHAFLLDKKHEIFFLPGGQGAYIFSYKGQRLEMKRAVSETSVRRAIYLDDYLYLIGDSKIVVLNELDWTKVNELSF
ncbi:MAG: beta-propeller domain-containing protein [bacterium]|nr:beta-propeller domain-containing protein [bacterium]